jgi:Glycosyltransferase family 87
MNRIAPVFCSRIRNEHFGFFSALLRNSTALYDANSMPSLEDETNQPSFWRNGLLLTLLAWLMTWLLYRQTTEAGFAAGEWQIAFDAAPLSALRLLARLPRELILHLSPAEITEIWFFICVVCLLASIGLFARAAGVRLHDAAPLGIMMIIAFHFRPTTLDIVQARCDLPVLLLLCAAYLADSRDQPYRLAACIVAAALIKPWLLGLLLYLLLRRKPLAVLWGIALFVGVMALLLAQAGWRHAAEIPPKLLPFSNLNLFNGYANQSIVGFATVHFAANPDAQPILDTPILLYGVVGAGFAIVLGGLLFACRRVPAARTDHARLAFGLTILSLLMVLPLCERANLVLVLPLLWTLLISESMPCAVRVAAVLVFAILTRSFLPSHQPLAAFASLWPSAFFLAAAILWLALIAAIGHTTRRPVRRVWQAL